MLFDYSPVILPLACRGTVYKSCFVKTYIYITYVSK